MLNVRRGPTVLYSLKVYSYDALKKKYYKACLLGQLFRLCNVVIMPPPVLGGALSDAFV